LKVLLHKYLLFMLALVHLAAAVGYAGIVHHCLHHHHAPAAEAACCSANQPEVPASCCPVDPASSSPDTINCGPMLVTLACCEMISLYHRVEESGPPAAAALVQSATGPIALLPHVREFSMDSLCHTLTPIAANQLNLPLLI